jgi:anti-sigma regulatory factor (Ser/Thr protein kinase)
MTPGKFPANGPALADHFALELPARTRYLAVVRELVARAALEQRFPPPEVTKTVMAVDEACVNIIEHAYSDDDSRPTRRIVVEMEARPAELVITIGDRSRSRFSPLEAPPSDLETYLRSGERRGLGLLILRNFMDAISHTFEAGRGNRLRLVKYGARSRSS